MRSVAFSPDGLLLGAGGVGGHHGTVWLWDAQTGKETQHFEANASAVDCVAFSPNSRLIAFGGDLAKSLEQYECDIADLAKENA